MAECKYEGCNREAEPGSQKCIFHISLEEKRKNIDLVNSFKLKFDIQYKLRDWDFTGFVFPDNMELSKWAGYDFIQPLVREIREPVENEDYQRISFSRAEFGINVNFANAKFGAVDFTYAKFTGKVIFNETEFDKSASFGYAEFNNSADFPKAKFGEKVDFFKTKFRAATSFDFAEFNGYSGFRATEFNNEATFRGTKFTRADFDNVTFRGNVDLSNGEFERKCIFSDSAFLGDFTCKGRTFKGSTYFNNLIFGGVVNFVDTCFSSDVSFQGIRGVKADFKLQGSVGKDKSNILEGKAYSSASPQLIFENTHFESYANFLFLELNLSRFKSVDLSNVSFYRSYITETQFIGCDWGSGPEKTKLWHREDKRKFGFRRPSLLFDELLFRKKSALKSADETETKVPARGEPIDQVDVTNDPYKDLQASDVEALALQLKQSLEATRDPIPAGDFHFAVMEMKRERAKEKKERGRASMLWWYKMISGYGECYGRTLLWLGVLVGVSTLIFAAAGAGIFRSAATYWGRLEPALFYAVQHILPFKFGAPVWVVGPCETAMRWFSLAETMIGTTLFAFFALALRRRFKR